MARIAAVGDRATLAAGPCGPRLAMARRMHMTRLASLSFVAALSACTSDPQPQPPLEPITAVGSFEVIATLTFPADTGVDGLPRSEGLVLRLDQASDGSILSVWGGSGGSNHNTLQRTDATRLALPYAVDIGVAPRVDFSIEESLVLESAELTLIDGDGDGVPDAVQGSGTCSYSYFIPDVEERVSCAFTLQGNPDITPPELVITSDAANHDVLALLSIGASEPLDPATKAVLRYGDTRIEMAAFPEDAPYVQYFSTAEILPFATELRIELDPPPQDLGGLAVQNLPLAVNTMPDPGIFGEDGFEGEVAAVLDGAEIVTGVGEIAAIAGTRALLVESGDRAVLRVPLTGGETHVRFQYRMLAESTEYSGCSSLTVRAGFPGLPPYQNASSHRLSRPEVFDQPTSHEVWGAAGPIVEQEITVLDGTTGEVILRFFDDPSFGTYGPQCPPTALLIDELRAE
jgi:hypothetical protein